jgi:hypothetical protein
VNIEQVKAAPIPQCEDQVLERAIPRKRNRIGVGWNGGTAAEPERLHEVVPDGVLLDHRQAREHSEIVHIGRPRPRQTRTNDQGVLRIRRALKKALKLHRAPRAVDFPSIDLLEAEDIRLESVELRA